jgi:hypothetical protein
MTERSPHSIAERMADTAGMEATVREAVREAVLAHARAGRAVPTWRNGKVVWLSPEEIFALFAGESKTPPAA